MNADGRTSAHPSVLTINSGSSSLKFAVISGGDEPQAVLTGIIERIGQPESRLRACRWDGSWSMDQSVSATDHSEAAKHLTQALGQGVGWSGISAVGHRIVHGGAKYVASCRIDDQVVRDLEGLIPFAPSHLPGEIAAIRALRALMPNVPHVAAFDTAFHRDLPPVARRFALPRRLEEMGIRRYGFHGLSYRFLMGELERQAGADAARQRVILAHLGAGCSMSAVKDGRCIETTMGFTPAAGLMMATRCGDVDPGVLIHLMRKEGLSADDLETLVTKRSGLLGVSGTSPDVRDLLAREASDSWAREAIELFCYQARAWMGRLATSLSGLDTLVFTAGIGENSPVIRSRICEGLKWLGIEIDEAINANQASVISSSQSRVIVRVIKANEEVMIFHEATRLLS